MTGGEAGAIHHSVTPLKGNPFQLLAFMVSSPPVLTVRWADSCNDGFAPEESSNLHDDLTLLDWPGDERKAALIVLSEIE